MLTIKTKSENKTVVAKLTTKFGFKNDSVIARIAIAYSLQQSTRFDLNDSGNGLDNSGKEYKGYTLFGDNESVYRTLLNQHYKRIIDNDEYEKLIKLHLDDGLSKLNHVIYDQGKNNFDILTASLNDGLKLLDVANSEASTVTNKTQVCDSPLILDFGELKNGEKLTIPINNQDKYSNQHIAIAGTTGAGKTEFVKHLLWQIHNQSNGELKFIFFDPKGEGKSDKLKYFLDKTECGFVDVGKGELKFNPLSHVNLVDELTRKSEIQSFRDAVASINTTGPTQKRNLSNVIHKAFSNAKKNGKHPTIKVIQTTLELFYEEENSKPDSLTAIFADIADWFSEQTDEKLYQHNKYISLPATLPSSASNTIVFLILNYLKHIFMSCADTESSNEIKPMRYVIVIDEAHVYLKNKKASEIMESLLRLVRSKGVMVILMTQGVEDYKQDFDFSSQIGTSILLDINDKNNNRDIQKFLQTTRNDRQLTECLENLSARKGITKIQTTQLFDINLFFRDSK